ncbi:MAG: hypothetical protein J5759_05620 [Bacteroidales bacterium]|nr:hypothetical protein [Bacteroidales bacterium]
MKKIFRLALLLAAAIPFACVEPEDPNEPDVPVVVEPETLQLTFVLPGSGAKTAWAAGDEIVVHGEYAKDQVIVKLAASDISADGKTASLTVEKLYPYKREDCASTLYASWPASASDNLKHCFFYSKFNTTASPILAACNDASNTFQFQEVLGALKFSSGTAYESFTISGNKKESLGYDFLQVKLTDVDQNFKQYVGNPILELDVTSGKAENIIYIPAGTELAGGFTIKFRKNGDFAAIYKHADPVTIERGKILDLGNIASEIKSYDNPFSKDIKDLDAEGNANCYIVTAPGGYKFKAVRGNNSNDFFADVADAVVLWETWNDDQEVEANSVVASAAYAEDFVIIRMPATLHPGNAVVAIRDEAGTILWSWHIWVPKTAIKTDSYGDIMGAPVMSRNLGALVDCEAGDSPVDPLSYGLVYQWGRKDPFTNSHTALTNSIATWAGADEVVADGQISLEESIANPRLLGHINNGNWMFDVDESLWGYDADKAIYDPCPPGYRVPLRDTGKPFWSSDLSGQAGWGVNSACGWLKIGDPAAVFPIAGYRDDYEVGGMAKVGTRTLYWNARGSEAKGYGADLRYDKGTYNGGGSAPKARLGSVRCVAE